MKVRTSLGDRPPRDQRHGVSYLGIEKPADIIHEDPHSPGSPGISCAAYNQQMGQVLQHPNWPCIYILVNKLAQQHGPGPRAYKSFPLECCWVDLSRTQPAKKEAGDADWSVLELPTAEKELIKGKVPSWVADKFWQHWWHHQAGRLTTPAAAAAAAPSAAAAQPEAAAAGRHDDPGLVAGSSSGAAAQHLSAHVHAAHLLPELSHHSCSTAFLPDSLPGSVQQYVPAVTVAAASAPASAPTPPPAGAATTGAGAAQLAATCGGSGPGADLLDFLPNTSSRSSWDSDSTNGSRDQPAGKPTSSANGPAALAQAAAESEAAARKAQQAFISMCFGFDSWIKDLYPSKAEYGRLRVVLDVVQQALASKAVGEVWSVMAIHPVSSFSRRTSLRASHDLDLLIELKTNDKQRGDFQTCRDECFNAIATALSTPNGSTSSTAAAAAASEAAAAALLQTLDLEELRSLATSGWQIDCKAPHWLWLVHPVLRLQLDVHVCQSLHAFDKSPTYTSAHGRHKLLQHVISRAEHAAGNTTEKPPSLGPMADSLSSPTEANKHRTALLTPMMQEVVKGVPQYCFKQYEYYPDSLVTDVVRAVKAWAKFGLPHVLQPGNCCCSLCCGAARGSTSGGGSGSSSNSGGGGSSSSSPGAAGPSTAGQQQHSCGSYNKLLLDYNKLPPSYIWEVFVIYVLLQKLDAAKAAGRPPAELYPPHSRTLLLFMHVMEAASQLLDPASTEVIALYMPHQDASGCTYVGYTREQCELFSGMWGPRGPLYSPRIINPVDPSFNCTKHSGFTGWRAVAAAAGELHTQMQQLLQGGAMVADAAAAVQQDAGSSSAPMQSAWEQLVEGSSLRFAVAAFRARG